MSKIFVILQVMSGLEQAGGPNRRRLNNNIKKNNLKTEKRNGAFRSGERRDIQWTSV